MILNLKRGLLLFTLGLILSGLVSSACKSDGGGGIPPFLLSGGYTLEQSKTGFFIIVPKGIAQ
ncbi:hypothetical protein ACE5IS_05210 [Leptospira wolffii]|uniref:Lipoprotein n=1 Tax=Leptospira wolffii TaxID=409998 RepID=A0A2M9ZCL0_9LEPT|nr:hypothetical protein [Leptospira wolffii]EPG67809.1 putative lipoprotein [Leptospira wolffii serovar Khorat str. Khorat-H2]PJZ66138.1 hypothetical protein CH371_07545 [Leptospira wolffii]TGK58784.1 hypothetical protein EHQ32_12095 [Leptospira wolffii]TGK67547.1 hypothetical protein EHQ27_15400 [Leptospira wolffii]TGK72692.1 hypothetical protein EHQ35_11165 [Leptospira wolffii]